MLDRDFSHAILTLRLAHGKASAMDIELCEALRKELESVANRNDVRSVILTGTGSIFSAGVDLPRMLGEGGDYVSRFVKALDDVLRASFVFPKPLIAAVNGHAIAGGAIMAFACDYRLMSSGRIGVAELNVGVPFPPVALEIVRFAIPPQHLQSMVYLGKTIEKEPALAMGLIDEIAEAESLMPRAKTIAEQLGGLAPEAFAITKRQLREPFMHPPAAEVERIWSASDTHERIREYVAKTIGRR